MKNYLIKTRTASLALKTVATVAVVSSGLIGCQPRGESRTLDQIYSDARSSYVSGSGNASGEVKGALTELAAQLESLATQGQAGTDATKVAGSVAASLDGLMGKIGVTARPAMAELINQYRMASANTSETAGSPSLKLLVARTYTLLATELRTANFRG